MARNKNDLYPTYNGAIIVKPIMPLVGRDDLVLEPCAGHNHLGRHFKKVVTVDKYRYSNYNADYYLDITMESSWQLLKPLGIDWVITNPPFSLAPAILPLAYKYARIGVIFLLRLSYLEPCKDRAEWLKTNSRQNSHVMVMNPRINFNMDKDGTDSVTSAWFIWQKDYDGLTKIVYYTY